MKGKRLTIALAVLAVVVLSPVLYVLSIGPMFWLCQHGYLNREFFGWIYSPVIALGYRYDWMQDFLNNYAMWWSPP